MLSKFGFNQTWVERVMQYVKTVTYSFLQDGVVIGDVQPRCGIRQGDPILPYLYILCGLSSIMRRNEEAGIIHGCTIARGAPEISHLLFADDSYFFFRVTGAEAVSIKNILLRYEAISGQSINFNKSSVVFTPNTTAKSRELICNTLEVREVSTPGNQLGLSMHIGRKKNGGA